MEKKVIMLFLSFLFGAGLVFGNETLFQQANAEYQKKNYDKAIVSYEKILSAGQESAVLYYNLGNAWFKKNDLPRAILYYEKALKLSPGDADIQFNLKVANSRITDKIDVLPELFYKRWWKEARTLLSVDGWAIASLIFVLVFFGLLTIYLMVRPLMIRRAAFFSALFMMLFGVFSLIFAYQSYHLLINQREAIVFDPAVSVKSSPDEASTDLFMLHEGTKVRILDNVGDWYRVVIASGSDGWVSSQSLKVI
jgi:tetratricopeptide (TPR) repeat protein